MVRNASQVKIRKGKKEDFEKIWLVEIENMEHHKKITKKFFHVLTKYKINKKNKESFFKGLREAVNEKNEVLFIAEENNKIIAYLTGQVHRWKWSDNPPLIGRVNDLATLKKYQRLGIATKLMDEFKKWSKQKNTNFIGLNVWEGNEFALKLYQKQNYEPLTTYMVKKLK